MEALLVLLLLAVMGIVAFSLGKTRGRKDTLDEVSSRQPAADAESYRRGYLAGHMDGWRDAEAKVRSAAAKPVQVPATIQSPMPAPGFTAPGQPTTPAPVRPAPARSLPAPAQSLPVPAQSLPAPARSLPVPPASIHPTSGPAYIQPPVRRETPEEVAARKEKRDQQNINITLYVASLLLVAAGALFVGTSLPELLRFVGIWFITALFYGAGMVVHAKVPRLRPAAIAFVGTGLALIPVTGLAMYNFALHDGPAAWLVTSLLGTLVYVFTALRLDSRVLAYLSLTFVVSTAWSGVSVLGGALVWYFTALIGVAILLTLGALLRPRWLPPLYLRPLMLLHPFVVPAVAIAVTMTPVFLSRGEYALVMLFCGVYFTVMALVPGVLHKRQHAYAARLALTLSLLGLVWDVTSESTAVLMAAIICVGLQSLGMAFAGQRFAPRLWRADALACLGLQLVAAFALTVLLAVGDYGMAVWLPLALVLATAMAVGWKLGGGVEFAPGVVAAAALPFMGPLGAWPVAVMVGATGLYWFLRAGVRPGTRRPLLVLAGRIFLTLAVPAATAGFLEDAPHRVAFSVVAFIGAAALQQVLSAVLERGGVRLMAPVPSVAGFGVVALAALMVLPVFDDVSGRPAVAFAVGTVVCAGLAAGFLVFPREEENRGVESTGVESSGQWRAGLAELVAPAALLVSGFVGLFAVSAALGNLVLGTGMAYSAVTALRIAPSLHRQVYWWLARASATVLAASVYADAVRAGGSIVVAGEAVTPALLVLAAGAVQLFLPLSMVARKRFPQASLGDAAVVVLVMAGASVVLSVDSAMGSGVARGEWQPGVAAVVTALATVACGMAFRRHQAGWVFAPAGFILLMALRVGNVRDVEVLLGIYTAYSAFMAAVLKERLQRGIHLLALRVLATAFLAVVVGDATDSVTAVSVALALLLTLQHAVSMVLRRRGIDAAFREAGTWVALGAQLVLPFTYLATRDFDGGGRWVVLFEFTLVLVSAAVSWRFLFLRGSQYLGVPGLGAAIIAAGPALGFPAGTWLHQPLLDKAQVPAVLLVLAVVVVVLRLALTRRSAGTPSRRPEERLFWLVASLANVVAGGALALGISYGLVGLALVVMAAILFVASHLEDLPVLYAAAAPSLLAGAVPAASGALEGLPPGVWAGFAAWLLGGVGTAVLLYAGKVLGGPSIANSPWRQFSLVGTAGLALACSAGVGLLHGPTSLVGFVLVVAMGVLVVLEVPAGKWFAAEIWAVVSIAALQRAVLFVDGSSPNLFWAAQWYVVAVAVIAGLRYIKGGRSDGFVRLCVAAAMLSLSSIGTVFGGSVPQQLYVLVAHVVLLAAGLLLAERAFVWWGAAGVALCVMWALRSYAFAMLALVAVALIALAVWRLNRKPPVDKNGITPGGGEAVR